MRRILFCLCLVLGTLLPQHPSFSEERALDPLRVTWSRLRYEASKGLVSIETEIEAGRLSAGETSSALIEPGEGNVVTPSGADTWHLTITTGLLGARDLFRLWLDPTDGATLQRTELETGRKRKKDRLRTYRYTEEGVYRITQEKAKGERDIAPEEWSRSGDSFARYPEEEAARRAVTEPAALFYLLSVADLSSVGDRIQANLFSKGLVLRIDLVVEGRAAIDVDYVEESAGGEKKVDGRIQALELSVEGRPAGGGSEQGEFKLLGLTGEKRIFLSPTLRVPVLLTGEIEHIGKGRIQLRRITLE